MNFEIPLNDKEISKSMADDVNAPPVNSSLTLDVPMNTLRVELKGWFGRNAPSLGELYDGALLILYMPQLPGRPRFVAHAAREIANRLPEAITGVKNERFEWRNKLDELRKSWERAGFLIDGSLPGVVTAMTVAPSGEFSTPRSLMQELAKLNYEYASSRETNKERARRLFEAVDKNDQGSKEALIPIVAQWLEVTTWFVKLAHDSGRTDSNLSPSELERRFTLFEATLGALTREFFKTIGELDEILEKTNA